MDGAAFVTWAIGEMPDLAKAFPDHGKLRDSADRQSEVLVLAPGGLTDYNVVVPGGPSALPPFNLRTDAVKGMTFKVCTLPPFPRCTFHKTVRRRQVTGLARRNDSADIAQDGIGRRKLEKMLQLADVYSKSDRKGTVTIQLPVPTAAATRYKRAIDWTDFLRRFTDFIPMEAE